MTRDANAPLVSIVMTLIFPRGRALESIVSWTTGQTQPCETLELIVAANGAFPRLEDEIQARLSPRDRLVRLASNNEMELHDFAARESRGHWLLFTEPHVVAEPDCVAALLRYLRERRLDGACLRGLPSKERNRVARIEARAYDEDAAILAREGDWRKFSKHGCVLRRTAYLAVGGLEHRYERYAETILAARLHQQGFRIGFASEAAVTHYNSTTFAELFAYVWEYRTQACRFAEAHPGVLEDPGVPGLDASSRLGTVSLTRSIWTTFREAACHPASRGHRALASTMLRAGLAAELGPRWQRLRDRLRYAWARLALATAWNEDRRYRAYLKVWTLHGDLAVAAHYRERAAHQVLRSSPPLAVRGDCRPAELHSEQILGFHVAETWNGERFRWTGPVSCLWVDVAAGDWIVSLDTKGLRRPGFDEVRLFWNDGTATPAPERSGDGVLAFRVERERFVEPGPQRLTLLCSRLETSGAEVRVLGLPLFAITFREANAAARSAA